MFRKWGVLLVAVASLAHDAMGQGRDVVETRLEARKIVRDSEGREGVGSGDVMWMASASRSSAAERPNSRMSGLEPSAV